MKFSRMLLLALGAGLALPAHATSVSVSGRVMETQGHETPACRMVRLRNSAGGSDIWFRIPDTGKDDGILAVTLTALTSGLNVVIAYDPALTTGCGTEPKIQYISLQAAG